MDILQNPLIHLILFIGSFIAIFLCTVLLTRKGNKKGYIIAPLTFFLDLFVFNLVLYLQTYYPASVHIFNTQELFDWSAIVRLHAFIIILANVLIEPSRNKYDVNIERK